MHRPQLHVELDDALAEFTLHGAFVADWRPGREVVVRVRSVRPAQGLGAARWSFARKPGASKLGDAALEPCAEGAKFVPDAAGRYRVRCEVPLAQARATAEEADVYVLSLRAHPRLYVTPARLAELRQLPRKRTPVYEAFIAWVNSGNGGVGEGRFHDMGARGGCEDNALAYLITGDRRYAQNSIAYAQRILQKPMREHFSDVHAATFKGAGLAQAIAVHYDWCYDALSPAQRRAIADWLNEAARWSWVRSGRPIAHNDGGGRQLILSSAAYALLGDDARAAELLRLSHENFDRNLLPWLNDGGRGGRCGDGGEYEGLHGFYIVRHAALAYSATGEDVFSDSPFFRNRLKHILFGWYPRRLYERHGRYSLRQYYSPCGDHIRLGYVGDVQPYQSAAALCDRFRDTREAQEVRWLAGEWPTQWMRYCLKWALLFSFDTVPRREPRELTYFDEGFDTVYMRSDWSDDATWVLFENGPYVSVHQALHSGGFEMFKGDLLAARTGNLDHGNVGAPHTMNYLHRTIAANCLLINDPQEQWKGFLAGASGIHDGGGQRTNYPLSSTPDIETYLAFRKVFQRGRITRFAKLRAGDGAPATYAFCDLTGAYNNPWFHGGRLNRPKVTSVSRQLLYLRSVDSVLVFDRVASTGAEFKKTWLLHSLGELDVLDGQEEKVDEGEFHYTGATRAVIRYGWPKPVPSFCRCLCVTLLPERAKIVKIGGREDLPPGQTMGFPGDKWHGKHRHRHIKDFWVGGRNWPPGNPPETRWFGDPTSKWYVPGTPDESGGRGKWRIEVSPPAPAVEDVFFHVLCPRLGREGPFPEVRGVSAGEFVGALVAEGKAHAAAFFSLRERRQSALRTALPKGAPWELIVADLAPGQYVVTVDGARVAMPTVSEEGALALSVPGGVVEVRQAKAKAAR